MRATLLDANGVAVNVVMIGDGYTPPNGFTLGPDGEIGWTWQGGQWVKPAEPPAPPLTQTDYAAEIEAHVDETAKAKAYGGAVSLASYVTSTIPQWQAEALVFVAWRDAVWLQAYSIMAQVLSGQRAAPSIEALLAELPEIEWPDAPST
jgi:hypothetical protein